MSQMDRLAASLSLRAGARIVIRDVTGHQQAQTPALLRTLTNTPPASATALTVKGTAYPVKFCWGLHGFPPADATPWTMVDE